MPPRKTVIAIPDDLLSAVDRAAQACGESRDRFITRVLQEAVHAGRNSDVTMRLNDLFAGGGLAEEQAGGVRVLDAVGTDWTDERW